MLICNMLTQKKYNWRLIIMKKFIKTCFVTLSALSMFTVTFYSQGVKEASAATQESQYLTDYQVKEINQTLEELRIEANNKLANHEEDFTLSKKVSSTNKPIILSFKSSPTENTTKNKTIAPLASREKSYQAYIENTAGLNFSHKLYGSFVYENGQITGHSKQVSQTGWAYSKTHSTWSDILDKSVIDVHSIGSFSALQYFKEYKTELTVKLLGSGDYRITRAKIII